jgi:hypothetical protein
VTFADVRLSIFNGVKILSDRSATCFRLDERSLRASFESLPARLDEFGECCVAKFQKTLHVPVRPYWIAPLEPRDIPFWLGHLWNQCCEGLAD